MSTDESSRVITNLLDNACQYVQPFDRIRLTLENASGYAVLRVEDNNTDVATKRGCEGTFIVRLPGLSPAPDIVRGGLAGWQVKRVRDYIERNLAQPLSVEGVARVVALSSSHFSRAFSCSFGVSPHLYVMHRRVEMAQRLMLTTSESLGSIALSCGMSDQSHLTRWFRRVVGETPNSWRRARRGAPSGL